jgi:hypothetical protein
MSDRGSEIEIEVLVQTIPKQNLKGSECRTPLPTDRTFGGGLGERLAPVGKPDHGSETRQGTSPNRGY